MIDSRTLALYLGCQIKVLNSNVYKFTNITIDGWIDLNIGARVNCSVVQPILRPLNTMTEEDSVKVLELGRFNKSKDWGFIESQANVTAYLLSKSYDLFNLIEQGLVSTVLKYKNTMEEKTDKTNNELIAKFMGIKHSKDPFVKSPKLYWHYNQLNLMAESLSFDTSWDWLMPVVEKIENIEQKYLVIKGKIATHLGFRMHVGFPSTFKGETKLEATYKAVVEFIRWYNTTQRTETKVGE